MTSGPDLAQAAAGFGAALRDGGLPAGPDRCERFARAVTVMRPSTLRELRACGLATMVSSPAQIDTFDQVFKALFGDPDASPFTKERDDPPRQRGDPDAEPLPSSDTAQPGAEWPEGSRPGPANTGPQAENQDDLPEVPRKALAAAAERLANRDFAQLTKEELRQLADLMRHLTLAPPPRRTRRYRPRRDGNRPDLRATLRHARRTGGEPIKLARKAVTTRPRRLVVLCDISGSMEPYARAMLQLIYYAGGTGGAGGVGGGNGTAARGRGARTEVFTFATRLTRLTRTLAASRPDTILVLAGQAAPDWSGGTRIGPALKEFNDVYGCRGMARGAVVLIISDGWETGDPALLGWQMARLSRVAHKIVWANPRTQSPRYRPEVGGMAAAWPYCDAVVSAHSLNALDDLVAALS
jgi:uncharacterized protein with von Willebrand factor type A (vWA) domain